MNIEIERRFFVTGDGWRNDIDRRIPIEQAYLMAEAGYVIRVRKTDTASVLSIKRKVATETSQEFEYPIPLDDADTLIATARYGTVKKHRHLVTFQNAVWHIDEFIQPFQGLVIAEIELQDNPDFARPPWLGDEITGKSEYSNAALAKATIKKNYGSE